MNNEPVAWLHIQGGYSEASARPLDDDEIEKGWEQIPLYTHPAELTDEEIDEVVRRWFGNSRYDFSANTWRQFSRAILRKAQEK
jgi:hypothetical protein